MIEADMAQTRVVGLKRYRRNGVWRWNVKAANGRLLANGGEGYKRRVDMEKAIRLTATYLKAAINTKADA